MAAKSAMWGALAILFVGGSANVGARPSPTAATAFLDHRALLGTIEDPDWYEANIPFLDVPDQAIREVYYYRWHSYREHLLYTGPLYGWTSTEFITPVRYAGPYGGISAAAGHHIIEGRWLRDQRYGEDLVRYWLDGPGQFPKPGYPPDLFDHAHGYSFWAGTAVWRQFETTGNRDFALAQLPGLIRQYRGWDVRFDPAMGMYWQSPARDGTERVPASFESDDPMRGGVGYRPTINSYQYADALGIAGLARLSGDGATAARYSKEAAALRTATRKWLWDPERRFFYEIVRDGNPQHKRLDTRVEAGFVPWAFGLPELSEVSGFAQLFDAQGFAAPFGPTTVERRSRWFNYNIAKCCHWTGPSWPFQTSQVLTGMENLLNDYGAQQVVTPADYVKQLQIYARTQHKGGQPYIAEAHETDADRWLYDKPNHSEDYNHSTYVDNVIAGLIGLRAQPDDTLVVNPLAPAAWPYFALENTPYHGHTVTVLWDRDGRRYRQGAGFKVFVDGRLASSQPTPRRVSVKVGAPMAPPPDDGLVNVAANPLRAASGPQPQASYATGADAPWRAIDGSVFRVGIIPDSRWTSEGSPHPSDALTIDLHRPVTLRALRLTFYDDGKRVRVPATYRLDYWNGSAWAAILADRPAPLPNATTRVSFTPVTTSRVRVSAPNRGDGVGWGLSEVAAMAVPTFRIENVASGEPLGRSGIWEVTRGSDGFFQIVDPVGRRALTSSGARVGPARSSADGNVPMDQRWMLHEIAPGEFRIISAARAVQIGGDGALLPAPALNAAASLTTAPAMRWHVMPAALAVPIASR